MSFIVVVVVVVVVVVSSYEYSIVSVKMHKRTPPKQKINEKPRKINKTNNKRQQTTTTTESPPLNQLNKRTYQVERVNGADVIVVILPGDY